MSDNNLPGISGATLTVNLDQAWHSDYDKLLRESFINNLLFARNQIHITNEVSLLNSNDVLPIQVDNNNWQWTMKLPEEDIIKDEQYHYPF